MRVDQNWKKWNQHTAEYKAKLKELGIVLPKVAFEKETPNFVVDIAKLPDEDTTETTDSSLTK